MDAGVETNSSKRQRQEQCVAQTDSRQCALCQDPLQKKDPYLLPCGLSFHAKCIMKNVCFLAT